jgi:hypothetical protein
MDNEELQNSNHIEEILENELFSKIWLSPRLVFKYLNEKKIDKYITILLILGGIVRTFDRASLKNMGDDMSLISVILLCVILGGLFGWLTFYIYAALLSWTGKWLKGQGDTNSLLRMVAYAMIPPILSLVLLIPQIALYGISVFQSNLDVQGSGMISYLIYYVTLVLEFILGVWTIVLFVVGISEVQKLSIGKSIINMVLPGLIILGPIFLIAFIYRIIT